MIQEVTPDQKKFDERVSAVAEWKIDSTENFIKQMLINHHDMIASEYVGFYYKNVNDELIKFAISNSNEVFLKYALRHKDFEGKIRENQKIIKYLMDNLNNGNNTELMLNVLIFTQFEQQDNELTQGFIEFTGSVVNDIDPSNNQNLMFQCYNPILVICLFTEILMNIGDSISAYKHDCDGTSQALHSLGEKLIENMDESKISIETIFMETDFHDRTVLRLIQVYQIEAMMKDYKIAALLDELWVGKNSQECDGRVTNYSLLSYLSSAQIRKLPGQKIETNTLLGESFKKQIHTQIKENFSFQFKFRRSSVAFLFKKELIATILICIILIGVNVSYLTEFNIQLFKTELNDIKLLNTTLAENDLPARPEELED